MFSRVIVASTRRPPTTIALPPEDTSGTSTGASVVVGAVAIDVVVVGAAATAPVCGRAAATALVTVVVFDAKFDNSPATVVAVGVADPGLVPGGPGATTVVAVAPAFGVVVLLD